jgi:hypothetical protein
MNDLDKGETADSQDSESLGVRCNPWNPIKILGIPEIPGVRWKSWEYVGNPGSTVEIPGIHYKN